MPETSSDPAGADSEGARTERRRIAQLLHDSVAQSLTAAYLRAAVLVQKMDRDGSGFATEAGGLADTLHAVVEELREVTRLLSSEEDLSVPGEPSEGGNGTGPAS